METQSPYLVHNLCFFPTRAIDSVSLSLSCFQHSMVLRPSSIKGLPNTFLRKKRKWPHSPSKTQSQFAFNQQQALQNLKQLSLQSPPNSTHQQLPNIQNPNKTLLNCLIDSFAAYNCQPTPNAYQFVIETLVQKSQFSALDHVLSHLQNVEKFETPECIFVDLIRVYGQNGMVREAIDLFLKIPTFRCVPSVNSLNSLLLILCRSRVFMRFVPQLLLKSRVMNIRMEESSFSILISALCRIGRVDYAIRFLYYMIDDGFSPDDKVCSLILSSLCQQKGATSFEVMHIMEGMKKIGFCPRREDFRNVIKFSVDQGKSKDAFDFLSVMKKEGIKPDVACYTMVLHGFVEKGEFARVEELFDELLVFGLIPDVHTYNTYINGLCKQKKVNEAYTMISFMQELDCQPDLVTYRIVLEAFYKVGESSRVREVWMEIKRKGIEIDMQTYGIMIDALITRGEVSEACKLFEEVVSNSPTSMSCTLDHIICSLCHGGLASEVLHTLEKASHNVVPGSRAWEALLLELNLNLGSESVLLAKLVNLHEEYLFASG